MSEEKSIKKEPLLKVIPKCEKAILFTKLLNIQKTVNGIMKDKQTYSYNYATGDKVLNIIRPLMNEEGLILVQEVDEVENTIVDYKAGREQKDKREILSSVKQVFKWIDCDTGFEYPVKFHANGMNEFEKGLGSALTYAERYFLLKFFHIPTDKDDVDNPDRKKEDQEREEEKNRLESEKKKIAEDKALKEANRTQQEKDMIACKTLEELKSVYDSFTEEEKKLYVSKKDAMKNHIIKEAKKNETNTVSNKQ